jgi:hypothetical protein
MAKKRFSIRDYLFHGSNIFSQAVNLGIFSTMIFYLTQPALLPHFLVIAPYFKGAALAIASIGWVFSAYEYYYEANRRYITSRRMDFLFKTLLVVATSAGLITAFSLAAVSPIITMATAALSIVYVWTQALYHSCQYVVSNDPAEKKEHRNLAIAFSTAFILGVGLLGLVVVSHVAHVWAIVSAVGASLVAGAAKLTSAIKKFQKDKEAALIEENAALKKELAQTKEQLAAVKKDTKTSGVNLSNTQESKSTKSAGIDKPRLEEEQSSLVYQFPEIKTREELLQGLDLGIHKAEQQFQSFGHVSTYHLQEAALKVLKHMVETAERGHVEFLDKEYRWNNLQEMKQAVTSLYEVAAKNHLFESKQGNHRRNSVQFLFDQVIYGKIDLSPAPAEKDEKRPSHPSPHEHP